MKIINESPKKFSLAALFFLLSAVLAWIPFASADTVTEVATVQASLNSKFEMKFYTDANVLYSTSLPFGTINVSKPQCKPIGRTDYDGKSDIGLQCTTNYNVVWYLKMRGAPASSPAFPMESFQYYMSQPWNRNLNQQSDGSLAKVPAWYSIPTSATTVYTAGPNDKINTEFGTLATFSFAIIPQHVPGGRTYIMSIVYTMTVSP